MFKILLVDDHRAFRKEFLRLPFMKATSDFEVAFEANDGQEALRIAKDNKIDVIISDIRMPVMDGIELLRALKSEAIRTHFIILSEYGTFEYAQQAINLGAFGYLTKPVCDCDVEAMLTKVKNELSGESFPLITTEDIDLLTHKMLDNSPSSKDLIESLFKDVKSNYGSHELLHFSAQFMSALNKRIFDYVPWLSPFISEKLFLFKEEELLRENYQALLFQKIVLIQAALNKFGFSLSPSSKAESIQGICIFILTNIKNPDLNSTFIADEFFFNKTYLSQLFKQKMSIPMIKFITLAKMEYAKVQLENENTRISELSAELNFENPDYFSTIFKKTYGLSPAAYQSTQK